MEFANQLLERLETELHTIALDQNNILCGANRSAKAVSQSIAELKTHIKQYDFKDQDEEINFFKYLKPKFAARLIYYNELMYIETNRPQHNDKRQKKFILKELDKLAQFINKNREFYQYYQSEETYLDNRYFTRECNDSFADLHSFMVEGDPEFSTSHGTKVAQLMANDMLKQYLNTALHEIECGHAARSKLFDWDGIKLQWTGPKASLIELIYGLQTTGVFNDAQAEVKHIASFFEAAFNVDLGNYYRTFQELRIRKKSRTHYIDEVRRCLIKRMDDSDEGVRH